MLPIGTTVPRTLRPPDVRDLGKNAQQRQAVAAAQARRAKRQEEKDKELQAQKAKQLQSVGGSFGISRALPPPSGNPSAPKPTVGTGSKAASTSALFGVDDLGDTAADAKTQKNSSKMKKGFSFFSRKKS